MQAGLATKRFNFRDIFAARDVAARFAVVRSAAVPYHRWTEGLRCAA